MILFLNTKLTKRKKPNYYNRLDNNNKKRIKITGNMA